MGGAAGRGKREDGRAALKARREATGAAAIVEPDPDDDAPYPPPVPPSTKSRRSSVVSTKPEPTPDGLLIPPLDLLNAPSTEEVDAGAAQIDRMGEKLIETLQTFRVEASVVDRTVGPVVTQYEVAPGRGVKVGRIAALAVWERRRAA